MIELLLYCQLFQRFFKKLCESQCKFLLHAHAPYLNDYAKGFKLDQVILKLIEK